MHVKTLHTVLKELKEIHTLLPHVRESPGDHKAIQFEEIARSSKIAEEKVALKWAQEPVKPPRETRTPGQHSRQKSVRENLGSCSNWFL